MSTTLQGQSHLVSPEDEFNRTLVENVHPPAWTNPKPSGRYNLVVIGAGTAGLVSAAGAAGLGGKVALIERHLMGGDCLNYGCVPSKALISVGRVAHAISTAADFGVSAGAEDARVNFSKVMERMRRLRAGISHHDSAARFTKLGVDVFLGDARFVSQDTVEVGGERLTFAKAVIASGARAAGLPVPGMQEAGYLTNETIFSLTELPSHLLVIGSGPIGCELAQSFRRFGSRVTILTDAVELLHREDPAVGEVIAARFAAEGIEVRTQVNILRAETQGGQKTVVYLQGGVERQVTGDKILIAAGRVPNIEGLNLEAAGVKYDHHGVTVDEHLRTSNKNIYAAGDICSGYKFTHAADAMARVVIQNALFFGRKRASDLAIPWCTFTEPEVAHVGITERDAQKQGREVSSFCVEMSGIDRAILDGETEGFAKVVTDKKTGRILGATIVGLHAGEMIGEMVLAIREKLTLASIAQTIHPYPTQAEVIKRTGDASMRSRLTPRAQGILKWILKVRR
jgi:pyruvate/2-oxoglutarate dehydrogenase complex dihydrolipoamide dehydrogenase (E3) component